MQLLSAQYLIINDPGTLKFRVLDADRLFGLAAAHQMFDFGRRTVFFSFLERNRTIEINLHFLTLQARAILFGRDAPREECRLAVELHFLVPVNGDLSRLRQLVPFKIGGCEHLHDADVVDPRAVGPLIDVDFLALNGELVELDPSQRLRVAVDQKDVAIGEMIELQKVTADVYTFVFGRGRFLLHAHAALTFQGLQIVPSPCTEDMRLNVPSLEFERFLWLGRRRTR